MSPPGQWAPSEPAWLRVAWVAGLALSSVAVWILFLLGSLRGRPPTQARAPLTTGRCPGPVPHVRGALSPAAGLWGSPMRPALPA